MWFTLSMPINLDTLFEKNLKCEKEVKGIYYVYNLWVFVD